jgi:DNA-binding HxlR family transcriptional regulator
VSSTSQDDKLFHCPALVAIKIISGKWKTRILWLLRDRAMHFGELRKTLPGVSAKVLDEQLCQLETDGLIARSEDIRRGVRFVDYAYTDYGRSLIPVLDGLGDWGLDHSRREVGD